MKALVLLTTLPDEKSAEKLARLLVKKKLAACVSTQQNLVSYFFWKEKPVKAKECLLLAKVKVGGYKKIERIIKENHPYSVPEILALPVAMGSKEYLGWINKR